MYPNQEERKVVVDILSAYGKESFHKDQEKVRLGILKLAWLDSEKLEAYTQLACEDYRDLLCTAEYPLSSRRFGLSDKDPEKYKHLEEKESAEYDSWLSKILSA